jgi:hypothetical protein
MLQRKTEAMKVIYCLSICLSLASLAKAEEQVQCPPVTDQTSFFLNSLRAEQAHPYVWPKYKVSDFPIALLDAAASTDTMRILEPSASEICLKLKQPFIPQEDGEIFITTSTEQPAFLSVVDFLKTKNWSAILGYSFAASPPQVDPKYRDKIPGRDASAFNMLVHEGVHLYYQQDVFRKFGYQTLDKLPQLREEEVAPCYIATPEIKTLHGQEVTALIAAFKNRKNRMELKKWGTSFINLRDKRRSLAPMVIASALTEKSIKMSCRDAEGNKEIGEGIPQYISNETVLNLGISTSAEITNEIQFVTDYFLSSELKDPRGIASFYHIGALELMILFEQDRNGFNAFSEKVKATASPDLIDKYFEEFIKGL